MSASGQYISPTFQQPQQFSLTTALPSAASQTAQASSPPSPTTYYFQATLRAYHAERLVLTRHPVQGGASIVDHAYVEPAELLLDVGFSDAQALPAPSQFPGGASQSAAAYQFFQSVKNAKVPSTLATRLCAYTNMVLVEVSAPESQETFAAALITLRFQQVILGSVTAVPASARPQLTGATNTGVVATQPPSSNSEMLLQNPDGTWNSNTQSGMFLPE